MRSGWGQIPVVDAQGRIIGIVTRTDLIKLWGHSSDVDRRAEIAQRLEAALPPALLTLLRLVSQEAATLGMPLYAVGGFVRDLLLGVRNWDVDLVVEGDAIALAQHLARKYGGRVRSHRRFGTAKWILPTEDFIVQGEGLPTSLDLVTARTEFYEHPTALPTVERSSIKQDLHTSTEAWRTYNEVSLECSTPFPSWKTPHVSSEPCVSSSGSAFASNPAPKN